jgi:hypothetical protein
MLCAADGMRRRFEWAGPPGGAVALGALLLAAAVLVGIWHLYRRERAGKWRWAACALRVGALAVLAALLLRPSVALDVVRLRPGRVVVLVDRSASMCLRDEQLETNLADRWAAALDLPGPEGVRSMSRGEIARRILQRNDAAFLRRLAARNAVELVTFGGETSRLLEVERGAETIELPAWTSTDRRTDLAGAVQAALREEERLAAVVALTDGRDTEGGDLTDAARDAGRAGVPLHFVGTGSPEAPPNVAVAGVVSNDQAVMGQPLQMRAFVRSRGYAGRRTELVLTAAAEEGEQAVLRREVTLRDGPSAVVDLTHSPDLSGAVRYRARIEPRAGEARPEDNEATRAVFVTEERIRVLVMAGAPSREYRFLTELLRRSPDLEVASSLSGAAPPTPEELAERDVLLLCDPTPGQIRPEFQGALAELVDGGDVGLAFLAGPAHSAELLLDPAAQDLRDLLPIVSDRTRARALVGGGGYFRELLPLRAGRDAGHPILQVAPAVEVESFWSDMPGLYWVFPVDRPKRGASVLLRCGEDPLVAVHSYGLGRVFYCGSPETWRWRREGITYYERFWLAALRYCTAGAAARADRARILLERAHYELGEPVRVRVHLRGDAGGPEALSVSLRREGEEVSRPRLEGTDETGWYDGVLYPRQPGRYSVAWRVPEGGAVVEPFEVRLPEAELADVRMNGEAMAEAARLSGGRYLRPQDLATLPDAVPDLSRQTVEPGPLKPAWDTPLLLALLVAMLAGEWALRKALNLL